MSHGSPDAADQVVSVMAPIYRRLVETIHGLLHTDQEIRDCVRRPPTSIAFRLECGHTLTVEGGMTLNDFLFFLTAYNGPGDTLRCPACSFSSEKETRHGGD